MCQTSCGRRQGKSAQTTTVSLQNPCLDVWPRFFAQRRQIGHTSTWVSSGLFWPTLGGETTVVRCVLKAVGRCIMPFGLAQRLLGFCAIMVFPQSLFELRSSHPKRLFSPQASCMTLWRPSRRHWRLQRPHGKSYRAAARYLAPRVLATAPAFMWSTSARGGAVGQSPAMCLASRSPRLL